MKLKSDIQAEHHHLLVRVSRFQVGISYFRVHELHFAEGEQVLPGEVSTEALHLHRFGNTGRKGIS